MVSAGLAIALLWGWSFVIAAQNDPVGIDTKQICWKSWVSDNFGIDTKQIAVRTLASETEAARAEVIEQCEAAAAYAARLHAAHAVLSETRREDAFSAEKRFAEANEAHAAAVDLLRARAASREKRISINAKHSKMKKRFDKRASRDDDVEKLAVLTAEVRALDRVNAHLRREFRDISRKLDNRDRNDRIFGPASWLVF
jgi:hypothetical protein